MKLPTTSTVRARRITREICIAAALTLVAVVVVLSSRYSPGAGQTAAVDHPQPTEQRSQPE